MTENNAKHPMRISTRDILFILFSKFRVLMGTFVLIVTIVAVHAYMSTPVYQAKGSALLKPLLDSRQRLHTLDRFDVLPVSQQDINTEIQIMRSDVLLRQVVEEQNLAGDYRESSLKRFLVNLKLVNRIEPEEEMVRYLAESLEIKPVTLSNIIEVNLKGEHPEKITSIINTFLNRYVDRHIEVHRNVGGFEFYDEQTDMAYLKLVDVEKKLEAFHKKWSIIDIPSQRAENVTLVRLMRESLSLVEGQIVEARAKTNHLEKNVDELGEVDAMPAELRSHLIIVDLAKALVPLMVEKERIELLYPENSIEYQDAGRQVARIQDQIRKEQKKFIQGLSLDLHALERHKDVLVREIKRIEKESRDLTLREMELNRLLRDVEQNKRNYQLYADRREEARIDAQRDHSRVANITVNSWATVPSAPVYPNKLLLIALSVVFGLISGVGCAFAAYYLDHTVKRPEDIIRWYGIPVFSAIEKVNDRGGRRI